MSRLAGRRVLITGASSGVGRAATDAYAREGAHVALLARGAEGLRRAALSAREHGVQAVVVPADVTDRDEVDAALAEAIARLGGLDVFVSCAAATVFGDFSDVAARDFDRTLEVTFLGAVNVVRAVLPELERHDGAIVTVGSILSRTSIPTFSSYCAAKHALRAFYEALSVELRARGSKITVATVHPGTINTPLWQHTSTGTNHRLPRSLPWAYSPEAVAEALLAVTGTSRELTLGAEAKIEQLILSYGGPIARLARRGVHTFYSSSPHRSQAPGSLWNAVGKGISRGNSALITRPSITAPLRGLGPPPSGTGKLRDPDRRDPGFGDSAGLRRIWR